MIRKTLEWYKFVGIEIQTIQRHYLIKPKSNLTYQYNYFNVTKIILDTKSKENRVLCIYQGKEIQNLNTKNTRLYKEKYGAFNLIWTTNYMQIKHQFLKATCTHFYDWKLNTNIPKVNRRILINKNTNVQIKKYSKSLLKNLY